MKFGHRGHFWSSLVPVAIVCDGQVERLEGEKLALRKQLVSHRHISDPSGRERGGRERKRDGREMEREGEGEDTDDAQGSNLQLIVEQLRTQVYKYSVHTIQWSLQNNEHFVNNTSI